MPLEFVEFCGRPQNVLQDLTLFCETHNVKHVSHTYYVVTGTKLSQVKRELSVLIGYEFKNEK